jgi:tyrosinase
LQHSVDCSGLSRRDFLATTGAAVAAATLPSSKLLAQAPAKFRRFNVSSPEGAEMLKSYKKAISVMLDLPASDPHNWYRQAFIHTLDCPHGNWWFLAWHRGYTGWFEKICREASGNPNFTLPYWDWTAEPRVPKAMFEGVLTPNDGGFIGTFDKFFAEFEPIIADYWKALDLDQIDQLLVRGLRFPEDLWFDIKFPRGPYFFDQPNARGLTEQHPGLDVSEGVARSVSLPTVLDALGPRDFITFGSPKTLFHSGLTGSGVLEGSPHNLVHNCVGGAYNDPPGGGFMQANLSPVDPLFFLHHANIDRLWDLWTRKQLSHNSPRYPILPQGYQDPDPRGTDWAVWSQEPFLFFVDADKHPVTKTTAGDYAHIGDFNYDYAPGSGEEVMQHAEVASASSVSPGDIERFSAVITQAEVSAAKPATATLKLPPASAEEAAGGSEPQLFAKVTVTLAPMTHAGQFRVLVESPDAPSGTHEAGVFAMFGHQHMPGPFTFTVPVSKPVAALRTESTATNAALDISVVADNGPAQMTGHPESTQKAEPRAEVLSIVVEAH